MKRKTPAPTQSSKQNEINGWYDASELVRQVGKEGTGRVRQREKIVLCRMFFHGRATGSRGWPFDGSDIYE